MTTEKLNRLSKLLKQWKGYNIEREFYTNLFDLYFDKCEGEKLAFYAKQVKKWEKKKLTTWEKIILEVKNLYGSKKILSTEN